MSCNKSAANHVLRCNRTKCNQDSICRPFQAHFSTQRPKAETQCLMLNDLKDVDVRDVRNGQILSYNDGQWVPITISSGDSFDGALECQSLELIWEDTFDGVDGSVPNPNFWTYDLGIPVNSEQQYYTDRPENVRIENNQLVIEARYEQNYNGTGFDYTSGRITTQPVPIGSSTIQPFKYGRVEARIKVPSIDNGAWPAFWMLGKNHDGGGSNPIGGSNWPSVGEIDIMEIFSPIGNELGTFIHGPGYNSGGAVGTRTDVGFDLSNDFHVYGIEWAPNGIRWLFDGQEVLRVNPDDLPQGSQWVFNAEFYILLNLALGGGGVPDSPEFTTGTKQMLVDWVRYYAPSNAGANNTFLNKAPNGDLHECTMDEIVCSSFLTSGAENVSQYSEVLVKTEFNELKRIPISQLNPSSFQLITENTNFNGSATSIYINGNDIETTFPNPSTNCDNLGKVYNVVIRGENNTLNSVDNFFDDGVVSELTLGTYGGSLSLMMTSCVDGIGSYAVMNRTEYNNEPPLPLTAPTSPPTVPTETDNVQVIYANDWGQGGNRNNWNPDLIGTGNNFQTTVYSELDFGGNTVLCYTDFNYVVTQFDSIDISGNTHVHFDVWSSSAQTILFKVVSANGFPDESSTNLVISPANSWIAIDIPIYGSGGLNDNGLMTLNDVTQIVFGTGNGLNIYVDNIYFYGTYGSVGEPTTAAPTPTIGGTSEIIYSSTLTQSRHTTIPMVGSGSLNNTLLTTWSQATRSDFVVDGTTVQRYSSLDYAGIDFEDNRINAGTITNCRFYMALWTTNITTFKYKVVNFFFSGGFDSESNINITPNNGSWTIIDVPLSDLTSNGLVNYDFIQQIVIDSDIPPDSSGEVFIDHILFYQP